MKLDLADGSHFYLGGRHHFIFSLFVNDLPTLADYFQRKSGRYCMITASLAVPLPEKFLQKVLWKLTCILVTNLKFEKRLYKIDG